MNWPATKDIDGKTGVVFIPFEKVLKFSTQGNRILIHTVDDVYYHLDGMDRIDAALQAAGLSYERADRGNLIDITKVIEIDEKKALAYFEGERPGEKGKESTISKPENFNRIINRFKSINNKL